MRKRSKPICDVEVGHRTASVCNIGNITYQLKRPLAWNPKKEFVKNDPKADALLGRPMTKEWRIKLYAILIAPVLSVISNRQARFLKTSYHRLINEVLRNLACQV